MIELIGCILIVIIGIFSIYMIIDELRANYELRKKSKTRKWWVMDNDTLGDYWRDVSPILKEKAKLALMIDWNMLKNNLRKTIFLISYVMKP